MFLKKLLLTCAGLLFIFTNGYSQNIEFGIGPLIAAKNSVHDAALSAEGFFEVHSSLSVSFRISGGSYSSTFMEEDEYFKNRDYSLTWFEFSVLYRPLDKTFQPYAGAGIGYYLPDKQSFNKKEREKEFELLNESTENKLGVNVRAGINFYFKPEYSLFIDFRYMFLSAQSQTVLLETFDNNQLNFDEELKLNTFFISMGATFGL